MGVAAQVRDRADWRTRWLAAVAAAAGLILVPACGGSEGPGAPPPPTSPSPDGTTVSFTGTVEAYGVASHDYAPDRDGLLNVVLTWTGSADLDLYLTTAECTGYPPDACAMLARSVEEEGTREQLSRAVRSGQRYKVWVDNLSPAVAAAYRLELTLR